DKGFRKVRVEVAEGNSKGDRGAIFNINEGPRQRISKVDFIGNTIASDARLKTQIQAKPPIVWLFKGYYNEEEIDNDKNRLTAYYRSLGFFRANIQRMVDFDDEGNWAQ